MSNCRGRDPVVTTTYVPVHDTITVTTERIVEKTKPIFVTDTLLKIDTVYVGKDGTYVELPMKWSEYTDTIKNDSSEARIDIKYHGIAASLDEIKLDYTYYNKQTTIVKPGKKYGLVWAVGPSIGFSGSGDIRTGTLGYGPTIGISATIGIGGMIK